MIFGEIIGSCSVFSPATTGIVFEESSDLVTDSPGPPFPAANHPNCKTVAGDRECCLFRVYCVEVWKCRRVLCGSFIRRCPVTRVVARSRPQPQHFPRIQLILVINRLTIIEIYWSLIVSSTGCWSRPLTCSLSLRSRCLRCWAHWYLLPHPGVDIGFIFCASALWTTVWTQAVRRES